MHPRDPFVIGNWLFLELRTPHFTAGTTTSEASAEDLHDKLAATKLAIEPFQRQLADAHVGRENTTADPQGGHQLDDTLPFQISQVLKVLNGYDRYKNA
jgi:hypothetical protein